MNEIKWKRGSYGNQWHELVAHRRRRLLEPFWKTISTTLAVLLSLHMLGVTAPAAEPACSRFQNSGQPVAFHLPTEWTPDSASLAWQAELTGYGQSSPVISNDRVYVTSTSGKNKDEFHVAALDLNNGKLLWKRDFANPTPEENSGYVSRAAPTPVVDAQAVYVLNEGGLLTALDPVGATLWERNLVAEYGEIKARHGLASSLEQNEKHIFVWIERSEDPYLMAVSKASGETTWKVPGLASTTWGSPRLISVGDTQHLVCSASGKIVGLEPSSGERLWELSDIANNTSSTPIPAGDGRFVIGASDGRGEASDGNSIRSNGLVQIASQEDGTWLAEFLWRAEKARCSFGSPLVAAGRVWIVNRSGALYQLDLDSGEERSVSRIKAGSIWATPLYDGRNVFLFGQRGTTSVLSAADGSEIAVNHLWEAPTEAAGEPSVTNHIQYAATACDGYLLIRRGDKLYAIRGS